MPNRTFLPIASMTALLVFASAAAAAPPVEARLQRAGATPALAKDGAGAIVSSGLRQQLATGRPTDFVVELSQRADLSAAAGMPWQERGRFVVETLRRVADTSQAPVRRALEARGLEVESHWIKNVLLVRGGTPSTAAYAAGLPGVQQIRELPEAKLIMPEPGRTVPKGARKSGDDGIAPNIAQVRAPQVWGEGARGTGITVGIIDTGAMFTHEALRQQYRGWQGGDSYEHHYNWFFPIDRSEAPIDGASHGTHVTGTIVGDDRATDPTERDRIGMAPGAQWIACLGLPAGNETASSLLACGEFMLAPTRTDGSDPNPDVRPHVVNNSWSEGNCNGAGTSFYADVVDAWIAAGIFPVFAAGNASSCQLPEPPGLSTVSSPAALPAAFAVGSTGNHDGQYATHSMWGPSLAGVTGEEPVPLPDPRGFPQLKPQVVAPGVDIVSAWDSSDGDYSTMTGTSMSAPHISGLVALMLDAGDCLVGQYHRLGTMIMETARPIPYATGGMPPPGVGDVPNYATGWGEIDAVAAVHAAASFCGPHGLVTGRITDPHGDPVPGARVELMVPTGTRTYSLTAEPDGSYARRLPPDLDAGYQLRITAYGYLPYTMAGIQVADQQTVRIDAQLEASPLVWLRGRVTDAATGWPLRATIRVAGYPHGAIPTDPATGEYEVQLPIGDGYRIDVISEIPGYVQLTQHVDVAADARYDISLQADAVRCDAPGYRHHGAHFYESFDSAVGGTPPTGWSASSNGLGWRFGNHEQLEDPLYPIPPRDGRFAANVEPISEEPNDGRFDYLVSPPITLGSSHPVVRFASRFWAWRLNEAIPRVQVSDDDGETWHTVGRPEEIQQAWSDEMMSLAAFGGRTVRLRFHYDDGSSEDEDRVSPGWAIDDVHVLSDCRAPSGGSLVVGQVTDANTGLPLDGALVGAGGTSTPTRTLDSGLSGFFSLWLPEGDATLLASRGEQPVGYHDAQLTLEVPSGETIQTSLALTAGLLAFAPAEGPSATLTLGTTATVPFTLRNDGTATVSYGLEGTHIEEHFDGLPFPPLGWSADDNNEGCPWVRGDGANIAGGDGPAAQIDLLSCEGSPGRIDHSLYLPPTDLSESRTASLGFFLGLHHGEGSDPQLTVEASTDAGASWTVLRQWNEGMDEAELVELDLSAFAGAANLQVRVRMRANPPYIHLQVDQVHLFRELGFDTPLSITPATGELAPGTEVVANATFDARGLAQPGTYPIPVRVAEDTPYAYPFGDLVGLMQVTAPPSYGVIEGRVQSLGRCESQPWPFVDLPVRITSRDGTTRETRTDVDGSFRYWLEAASGPFDVQIEGDGHQPASRNITLNAGGTATADFDLRPLAACLVADPASLSMSAPQGEQATEAMELHNLGPLAGNYAIRVGGDPELLSKRALTQNESAELDFNASVACVAGEDTLENRWYRVYPMAGRGYTGTRVHIDAVRFGADRAYSRTGIQQVRVSAYELRGDFNLANLQKLAETTAGITDGELEMHVVPFDPAPTIAADATLVIEVAKLDGLETGSTFLPAGNFAPDTAPAYFLAPDCDVFEPTSYDDLRFEALSPVIDALVRAGDGCSPDIEPAAWLQVSPAAGTVDGDSAATLLATADAAALDTGAHRAVMCVTGPTAVDHALPVRVEFGVDVDTRIELFSDGFE